MSVMVTSSLVPSGNFCWTFSPSSANVVQSLLEF
jgi:hypothetical protein